MKRIFGILGIMSILVNSAPSLIATSPCQQQNELIKKEVKLKTSVASVSWFIRKDSNETKFSWTKQLPTGTNYKYFSVESLSNSSWAEGSLVLNKHSSNEFKTNGTNILLTNGIKLENKKISEFYYYPLYFDDYEKYEHKLGLGELFLTLEYSNNTIKTKITAKATANNPYFFGWIKAQAEFQIKIIVSENKI